MRKNPRYDQRTVQIPCILCNKNKRYSRYANSRSSITPLKIPSSSQTIEKNHIVLRLRYGPQLLCTVAKPFSEKPAGSDRIQCLHNPGYPPSAEYSSGRSYASTRRIREALAAVDRRCQISDKDASIPAPAPAVATNGAVFGCEIKIRMTVIPPMIRPVLRLSVRIYAPPA